MTQSFEVGLLVKQESSISTLPYSLSVDDNLIIEGSQNTNRLSPGDFGSGPNSKSFDNGESIKGTKRRAKPCLRISCPPPEVTQQCQFKCSIEIKEVFEGIEVLLDKCYQLLQNIHNSATGCLGAIPKKSSAADITCDEQLFQLHLGLDLIRQRLMTCAYYKMTAREMLELAADLPGAAANVDPRNKPVTFHSLIGLKNESSQNGSLNSVVLKNTLSLVDQLMAELDMHAVALQQGRLTAFTKLPRTASNLKLVSKSQNLQTTNTEGQRSENDDETKYKKGLFRRFSFKNNLYSMITKM